MIIRATIDNIFNKNALALPGYIPFSAAKPANLHLYNSMQYAKTIIIFYIPYRTEYTVQDNYEFSCYARTYDYHKRFEEIFTALCSELKSAFPGFRFESYADHSPINEKLAAADAGLGIIGKNTLLINKEYGSYIFLGSIITDIIPESYDTIEPKGCIDCKKCMSACPGEAITENGFDYTKCLSFVSQKKIKTSEEREKLVKHNIVWGCDICQKACPMNDGMLFSTDGYFSAGVLNNITPELIAKMDDVEFARYPFSWRKREVITENLEMCQNDG